MRDNRYNSDNFTKHSPTAIGRTPSSFFRPAISVHASNKSRRGPLGPPVPMSSSKKVTFAIRSASNVRGRISDSVHPLGPAALPLSARLAMSLARALESNPRVAGDGMGSDGGVLFALGWRS